MAKSRSAANATMLPPSQIPSTTAAAPSSDALSSSRLRDGACDASVIRARGDGPRAGIRRISVVAVWIAAVSSARTRSALIGVAAPAGVASTTSEASARPSSSGATAPPRIETIGATRSSSWTSGTISGPSEYRPSSPPSAGAGRSAGAAWAK